MRDSPLRKSWVERVGEDVGGGRDICGGEVVGETPGELDGVQLVVAVGDFRGEIGYQDGLHGVDIGHPVRAFPEHDMHLVCREHLLHLLALVGGERAGLRLIFLAEGDIIERCFIAYQGDGVVLLDFRCGDALNRQLLQHVEAVVELKHRCRRK